MKLRNLILSVCAGCALVAAAQTPALIGRRGCAGGVENSVEAYREAVRRGFRYVEGHVRVTADSVFVTSHDGKTARLGGALKVEESAYRDLASEQYTQTREDSVTYSGRIARVDEFLDICREGGAVAVLHLKTFRKGTAPGHLDALCRLVDSVSSPEGVIILTSEPEYIEYLQANHPEMPLMYQADAKWQERFDWARERGLDVSIRYDLITPECLEAYHGAGLKVAAWVVNTEPDKDINFAITDLLVP